jgi:ribosomal protein S12 methylthiotransferase accessory factor
MDLEITFPGGLRVDATFNGFTLRTDQTVKSGGEGTAPTPFMAFMASLGTCAGVYVLGFCRQRDIPADGIRVTQHTEADPATGMVTNVTLEIHVPPSFPEKYHSALVRAAEQCSVKKHLEHPPAFVTRTVVDATA